jgi:hypothetical protein
MSVWHVSLFMALQVRWSFAKENAVFRRVFWLSAVFAVAVSLLSSSAQAVPPPDPVTGKGPWEVVRNEKGIVVHRRAIAGSHLHEFRGTGVIEAPIAAVLGVLNDAEHRTEWMKEAAANTRVESLDSYNEIFYSRTKAPWPVAHRDVVLRAHTIIDPKAGQVRIELTSQEHPSWPPQKGVVRMPFLRGHWHLWPERGGAWTRAEYQVHANPGGSLPDWIVNMVSKKIPFETMVGMQQQVKRRTYPDFEKKLSALPEYQAVLQSGKRSDAADKAPPKPEAKPEANPATRPEEKPTAPPPPETIALPAT